MTSERERRRVKQEISILDKLSVGQFPQIQIAKIGVRLGGGMEHTVYRYGIYQVIKVPRKIRHHPHAPEQKISDFDTIKKYFPLYTLESEIVVSLDKVNYLLVQRRLHNFENITPQNIHEVWDQFLELIKINQRLVREEQISLDFLGKEGIEKCAMSLIKGSNILPEISNIVLERGNDGGEAKLVIQDLALLKLGDKNPNTIKGTRDRLLFAITFGLNKELMQECFGLDIAGTL